MPSAPRSSMPFQIPLVSFRFMARLLLITKHFCTIGYWRSARVCSWSRSTHYDYVGMMSCGLPLKTTMIESAAWLHTFLHSIHHKLSILYKQSLHNLQRMVHHFIAATAYSNRPILRPLCSLRFLHPVFGQVLPRYRQRKKAVQQSSLQFST